LPKGITVRDPRYPRQVFAAADFKEGDQERWLARQPPD